MRFLVGHTGFVGQNLKMRSKFDGCFNSTNIRDAFDRHPDLLVFAGLSAEKYLANHAPTRDRARIDEAFVNIKRIAPRKLVLISTIDIYKSPVEVDEASAIDIDNLHPYGLNRRLLELMVTEAFPNTLIVRLPGLFGAGIKKNFIFDIINTIPSMLSLAKLTELALREPLIRKFYILRDNGFYYCSAHNQEERGELRVLLERTGFNAACFTDSRAVYQFYNLAHLWEHIETALQHGLTALNLATEPVGVRELHQRIFKKDFINEIAEEPPRYDFHTRHAALFNGVGNYIFNKEVITTDIVAFVNGILHSKSKNDQMGKQT